MVHRHGGYGPFFYLPKMQHSREAAVWNAVFEHAEDTCGVPRGSIRGTVLIETLPAVFQMHEILYELREHSAGLNCGRWDYIFSFIKTVRAHPDRLLPDRVEVGMTQHFLKSYTELLIQTCHKRGVHAMGGMVSHIQNFSPSSSIRKYYVIPSSWTSTRENHPHSYWTCHLKNKAHFSSSGNSRTKLRFSSLIRFRLFKPLPDISSSENYEFWTIKNGVLPRAIRR